MKDLYAYTLIVIIAVLFLLLFMYWRNKVKKQSNPNTLSRLFANYGYILFIITLLFIPLYYFNSNKDSTLARSILLETNKDIYDKKCEKLFSHNKDLYSQYKSMKKDRPIAETRNLCGNYSKSILRQK